MLKLRWRFPKHGKLGRENNFKSPKPQGEKKKETQLISVFRLNKSLFRHNISLFSTY